MKEYRSPQIHVRLFQSKDLITTSTGRDWGMEGPAAPDQDWELGSDEQAD